MSLDAHWFSTIYGMLFIAGQGLTGIAFSIIILRLLSSRPETAEVTTPQAINDLGNLLLAFVMIWTYMNFSQYLIIWAGNLPEEIPWYVRRGAHGWQWVAAVLAVFHFAVPFLLLLGRANKRHRRLISGIALAVLAMRWVDIYWLIAPSFFEGITVHLFDFVLFALLGGIWWYAFWNQLQKRPLLPLRDPNFVVETRLA